MIVVVHTMLITTLVPPHGTGQLLRVSATTKSGEGVTCQINDTDINSVFS